MAAEPIQAGSQAAVPAGAAGLWFLPVAAVVLCLAAIHLYFVLGGFVPVLDGRFVGNDTYAHMVRALDLRDSGDWFDPTLQRINPPDGHVSHWTRPFDLLLLAGAWALTPLLGFKDGLFWWGAAISPFFHVLTLIVIAWGASALFSGRWIGLMCLIFLAQPAIILSSMPGRPDHHALQLFLLSLMAACMARLFARPLSRPFCYAVGGVLTFAIWTSVETLVPVFAVLSSLGLAWLIWQRDFLPKNLHLSIGAVVTAAIALFLERGPDGLGGVVYEVDRLSQFHVFLFALVLGFWTVVYGWNRYGMGSPSGGPRTVVVAAAAAGALALWWVVYPQFFTETWIPVDELYYKVRSVRIQESQPIISRELLELDGFLQVLGRTIVWLGAALPACVLLGYLLLARQTPNRAFWLYVAVTVAVSAAAALARFGFTLRDMPAIQLILIFPYVELVVRLSDWLARMPLLWRSFVRPLAVTLVILWPLILGLALKGEAKGVAANEACLLTPMARYLSETPPWRDAPRRIRTVPDFGPEVLVRTRHAVFSIPNHRLQPGFTDPDRVLTAETDAAARAILARRGVDLLLICRSRATADFFDPGTGRSTFRQRLVDGQVPPWITLVPMPEKAGNRFLLFEFTDAGTKR
jgi:hypothetical protein